MFHLCFTSLQTTTGGHKINLTGRTGKKKKLEAPEKEYTFIILILILITVSLYRYVEMIGSKVTSVVIYKASCHKIVKFYFIPLKKQKTKQYGEDALALVC